MADLSVGEAVKALIVDSGLVSGRVFRADRVPERPTFPYVTFLDPIADPPALSGDCDTIARARLVQVDLWQKAATEDFLLSERLVNAIDGAALTSVQRVHGCKVTDIQRLDDPDASIVHHAITVRVPHTSTVVTS